MADEVEPRGLRGYLAGENDGPGGAATFSDEQAKTLAGIIGTADGGCPTCVGDLCDQMAEAFPGHDWHALADEAGR